MMTRFDDKLGWQIVEKFAIPFLSAVIPMAVAYGMWKSDYESMRTEMRAMQPQVVEHCQKIAVLESRLDHMDRYLERIDRNTRSR